MGTVPYLPERYSLQHVGTYGAVEKCNGRNNKKMTNILFDKNTTNKIYTASSKKIVFQIWLLQQQLNYTWNGQNLLQTYVRIRVCNCKCRHMFQNWKELCDQMQEFSYLTK